MIGACYLTYNKLKSINAEHERSLNDIGNGLSTGEIIVEGTSKFYLSVSGDHPFLIVFDKHKYPLNVFMSKLSEILQ